MCARRTDIRRDTVKIERGLRRGAVPLSGEAGPERAEGIALVLLRSRVHPVWYGNLKKGVLVTVPWQKN